MRRFRVIGLTVLILILLALCYRACPAQLAFPGAEGDGAGTQGGRGGRIILVTTTAASGVGSFKAAAQDSFGARIVVFKTGGICTITDDITIGNPYITIAFQTAPGDGFYLKGAGFTIRTHDVIVRGERDLVGDNVNGEEPSERRSLTFSQDNGYNAIFDHCTFRWTIDSQVDVSYNWYGVTFQNCIFAEPLNNSLHPKGTHGDLMVADSVDGLTVTHCLFASNKARAPQLATDSKVKFVGNVVFNWSNSAMEIQERSKVNIAGNVFIAGSNTQDSSEVKVTGNTLQRVFLSDNIGPHRPTDSGNEWLIVDGSEVSYRSFYPLVRDASQIASQWNTDIVLNHVLENAGAKPTNTMDSLLFTQVLAGTGQIKDCVEQGVTIYWPSGTTQSFRGAISPQTFDTILVAAVTGGITANRYLNKTLEIDADGNGFYEFSGLINGSFVIKYKSDPLNPGHPCTNGTRCDSLSGFRVDYTGLLHAGAAYRVLNPCLSNYTTGYPTVASGSAPTDTDNDGIPDFAEKFINNNRLDSLSATATRDVDGDGYKDVEDWINEYYYHSLTPKLLGR